MPPAVVALESFAKMMSLGVVREIVPVPLAARAARTLMVPVVVPRALTARFRFAAIVMELLKVAPAPVVRVRWLPWVMMGALPVI